VGEHLADPLMIPLALAGSTFATATLSRHAETNLEVIRRFLGATGDGVVR
jgi:RNA 3'-terminal phosphate cyclase